MHNIKGLQKLNIKIVKLERDNKYTQMVRLQQYCYFEAYQNICCDINIQY